MIWALIVVMALVAAGFFWGAEHKQKFEAGWRVEEFQSREDDPVWREHVEEQNREWWE